MKKRITITINNFLYEEIKKKAEKEEMPISAVIEYFIQKGLRN